VNIHELKIILQQTAVTGIKLIASPSSWLLSFNSPALPLFGLGHNIGHSVGWVGRSETQQLIRVGFRSSTQPTGNPYGLKYDQGPLF
jgi:hypothetical protein